MRRQTESRTTPLRRSRVKMEPATSWIWCCAITLPQKSIPLGVYHPHQELHHIKKENIGLIEVMGLAVLPSRLKDELSKLADAIVEGKDIRADEMLAKHADWVDEFKHHYASITKENVDGILKEEVGKVFARVLEDAGVYKCTPEGREAFGRFLTSVGFVKK